MNQEFVIQSEVSQKEKNKHCILTHIRVDIYISVCVYMESRKMVLMNPFAGQQWRCRHREQTVGTVGEEENGTN